MPGGGFRPYSWCPCSRHFQSRANVTQQSRQSPSWSTQAEPRFTRLGISIWHYTGDKRKCTLAMSEPARIRLGCRTAAVSGRRIVWNIDRGGTPEGEWRSCDRHSPPLAPQHACVKYKSGRTVHKPQHSRYLAVNKINRPRRWQAPPPR